MIFLSHSELIKMINPCICVVSWLVLLIVVLKVQKLFFFCYYSFRFSTTSPWNGGGLSDPHLNAAWENQDGIQMCDMSKEK